ncbi:MAG: hypothetical protein EXS63_07385 [Candidatus Omnitrophica bacterium]|nr:hypothetical protein [Candidatus Omnitrophota bacterium]
MKQNTKVLTHQLLDGRMIYSKRINPLRVRYPEEEIEMAERVDQALQAVDSRFHAQKFIGIIYDSGSFYLISLGVPVVADDPGQDEVAVQKIEGVLTKLNIADADGPLRRKEILLSIAPDGSRHYTVVDFETFPYTSKRSEVRDQKTHADFSNWSESLALGLAPEEVRSELRLKSTEVLSKKEMAKEIVEMVERNVSMEEIQRVLEGQVEEWLKTIGNRQPVAGGRENSGQEMLNPQTIAPLMKHWIASLDTFKDRSFNLGVRVTSNQNDGEINRLIEGMIRSRQFVDRAVLVNESSSNLPSSITAKLKDNHIIYQLIKSIMAARKITLPGQSRLPLMSKDDGDIGVDPVLTHVGIANSENIHDVLMEEPEGILQVILAIHMAAASEEELKDPELLRKELAAKILGQGGDPVFQMKLSKTGALQVLVSRVQLRRFLLDYQSKHLAQIAA